MSEETEQDGTDTVAPVACALCDHTKHDGATCVADGCDCATDATATETVE